MRKVFIAILSLWLLAAGPTLGQQHGGDPVGDALFAPELVMSHQDILSGDQRAAIMSTILEAQSHFTRTQWQLSGAMEHLGVALKPARVNEPLALKQLDRVLDLERQVKKTQLTLMIRIKNELTPQQQATLARLKTGGDNH